MEEGGPSVTPSVQARSLSDKIKTSLGLAIASLLLACLTFGTSNMITTTISPQNQTVQPRRHHFLFLVSWPGSHASSALHRSSPLFTALLPRRVCSTWGPWCSAESSDAGCGLHAPVLLCPRWGCRPSSPSSRRRLASSRPASRPAQATTSPFRHACLVSLFFFPPPLP